MICCQKVVIDAYKGHTAKSWVPPVFANLWPKQDGLFSLMSDSHKPLRRVTVRQHCNSKVKRHWMAREHMLVAPLDGAPMPS